ncbi:MAG: PEP-CTERM sorting domain-containing protein [Pirellulales bacterium]|nr:PEP-CTERM sorting domain-containing protein [Pirellulales bacterium]
MKKVTIGFALLTGLAALLLVATPASAAIHFVVTPADLADGLTFDNGQGGVPFGYDADQPPPIGSSVSGPTGYESGSFWSDVQGSAAGGGRDYTAFRLSPKDIFGVSDVTIADLAEVSYWTKNNNTDLIDWQLKIYTESTVKWYGYRFNFTRPENPDNDWYESSTSTNMPVSDIYDKVTGGYISVPGSGALSDLDALYGDEKILFIDIIAGYASSSPPVDSYLDGVKLVLDDGSVATMNLEVVPEPGTPLIWLTLAALGLIATLRKRRTV